MGHVPSRRSFPLSAAQTRNFVGDWLGDSHSGLNVEQVVCSTTEKFNFAAFEEAWREITRRHLILSVGFGRDDQQQPFQKTKWPIEWQIFTEDRTETTSAEQEAFLEPWLEQDRRLGFDFERAPLLRLSVFRFADSSVTWVWTFHHILLDGRSILLVLEDFFASYDTASASRPAALPERRPFEDHVRWCHDWSASNRDAIDTFWRNLYQSAEEEIDPHLGIKRPVAASCHRQEKIEIEIDDADITALSKLTATYKLTFNAVIQGIWALLLSRYYRSRSVTFSTVRSCRQGSVEGTEGMIGMLMNSVPIHVRLSKEISAIDLFKQLRNQHLAVRPFQWSMPDAIRNALPVAASKQFGESCVLYERHDIAAEMMARFGRNGVRRFSLRERSSLPLILLANEKPRLQIKLLYQVAMFENADMEQMARAFLVLLRNALATPEVAAAELDMVDEKGRAELTAALTGPEVQFPTEKRTHEWFEEQVRRSPDSMAVVGEFELTYAELNRRATAMAHRLAVMGAKPGQRVAVFLPRSAGALIAILAVLKSGAAYLPIHHETPVVRVKGLIEDGAVCVVITDKSLADSMPPMTMPILLLEKEDDAKIPPEGRLPVVQSSDLAYVIATSGSTGRPKLIGVEHRQVSNLLHYATTTLLRAEDVRCAPFIDSIGFDSSISQIFTTLSLGGTLVLVDDVMVLNQSPFYKKFTCVGTTPSLLATILKTTGLPPAVRLIGLGAEAIPPELLEKLDASPQIQKVINYYGPSEATVYCTAAMALDRANPAAVGEEHSRGRIIGRPIANTRVHLVDLFGKQVPRGAPGEIYVSGEPVARGYLKADSEALQNFKPDTFSSKPGGRLYRSGDIAFLRSDGQLEFQGRNDQQLKINGVRIEAGEIENALLTYPGVSQALVDVRADAEGHKRLVAYLALNGEAPPRQKLRKALRLRLPDTMLPQIFQFLDELPVTSNGKIDRAALAQRDISAEKAIDPNAALTPVEMRMKALWEKNLSCTRIGLESDYFEMGGDSLSSANLLVAIEREFGLRLKPAVLLEHSTITDLLQATENATQIPRLAATGKTSFVCLQELGDGIPIIFIPGGTGSTYLLYKSFFQKFAPDHPVYAFHSIYLLMQEKQAEQLSYIADYIARELVEIVKDRPFILFSHCLGGRLAWHVASLLEQRNLTPFKFIAYDPPMMPEKTGQEIAATKGGGPLRRIRSTIRAYQPAWEEWSFEYGYDWRAKLGFARWGFTNFLVRRGWATSKSDRLQFMKLAYVRLVANAPLSSYNGDALLIYHRDQIVAESRWRAVCVGKVDIEYIAGDHRVWQTSIFSVAPLIYAELESLSKGKMIAPTSEAAAR